MDDRYETQGFSDDQLLDELMCEYVDGTMDPSIRKVFDELVRANPVVAQSCNCARQVQSILKNAGHHVSAPRQFQSRLRARLNAETGKIDVIGLTPSPAIEAPSFARYFALVAIFVCSGLVLSRHDDSQIVLATVASERAVQEPAPAPSPMMTPSNLDVDLSFAVSTSGSETIQIGQARRSGFVQTAEAELTPALAD